MKIRALAGWFGGNRMLAEHVGAALEGCSWVGVPFAGGMSEIPYITARSLLVNDLHRHVINLARAVARSDARTELLRRLRFKAFHPDELKESQDVCKQRDPGRSGLPDIDLAEHYFVCCWLGRSSKAGTKDEFNGRTATRWNADGGDSMVRYRSALRSLSEWGRTLRRCTFETMDAFDFLARCDDSPEHGVYCDPPFLGAGRKYKHNAGQTEQEEIAWHQRLRQAVHRFQKTRVVMRFYDHPVIRNFYPNCWWEWKILAGRKQSNESSPEVLLLRNARAPELFG